MSSAVNLKKRIENITNELNLEFNSKKNTDCKEYIKNFSKKINSVLYKDNFDKNGQLFVPIKGECYEDIYDHLSSSGLNSYFKKNERAIQDSQPNCIKIFLNKNKLYFVDWLCDENK
jgi:hypothetical protein